MSGKTTTASQFIKNGAFHTIELEPPRKFTIHKELWDSVALQMVDEACDASANADLAAVVMEMGLAHVCLVTRSMTIVRYHSLFLFSFLFHPFLNIFFFDKGQRLNFLFLENVLALHNTKSKETNSLIKY